MASQHTFATILNQAIQSSGLSLTDIVNELDKQGLTVSAASLSYWKTGKTLPTRKSSVPILKAIEVLCSLTPRTLIDAAQSDAQVNSNRKILNSTSHNQTPATAHTQISSDSEEMDSKIQWEYEAEREILIDSYHVSADFTQIQSEIMILARVTNPARSHLHISSHSTTDEERFADNETGLRYLEGATVGDIIRHDNNHFITLRLDLPEDRKSGEMQRVFYLLAPFRHSTPCTQAPSRFFAWPLRMYNCHVFFEGDVPKNIEWVSEETQEHNGSRIKQITTQRIQPNGNTVQVTLENVRKITGYFRWTL